MSQISSGIDVLFIAGFGPVSITNESSSAFYIDTLGLPLKAMEGNSEYLLSEEGKLEGVKHLQSGHFCRLLPHVLGSRSGRLI